MKNKANEKHYVIRFTLVNNKKYVVFLPYKNHYIPIYEAIKNICTLFSNNVTFNPKHDTIDENEEVIAVCELEETITLIKHTESFLLEPNTLNIHDVINPNKKLAISEHVNKIYEKLMKELNH